MAVLTKDILSGADLGRFWSNFLPTEAGCWEWQLSTMNSGYGQFGLTRGTKGKNDFVRYHTVSHRLSYELAHGPIPKGLLVRHKCDNRKCGNPDHLELGTPHDNIMDMVKRKRGTGRDGGTHWTKLTEAEVRIIKQELAAGASQASLSRRFNVGTRAIYGIHKGLTWKHVQ